VNHYIVHSYLFFNSAKIESACQWESSKSKLVKGWTKLTHFFIKTIFVIRFEVLG
jgi:hypothetical protein